jgi:nucleotide-binding universal stress UspA family protein
MKVLVGVNGSADSLHAVRLAARVLDPQQDALALFYSAPAVNLWERTPAHQNLARQYQDMLAEKVFASARAALPAPWSPAETIRSTQRPDSALLAAARSWGAEMIVVGARGGGPVATQQLGSVVRNVLRAAEMPVLVARPPRAGHEAAPLRLLVAHDESELSLRAAEFVCRLTLPEGSSGRVISVVESPGVEVAQWAQHQPSTAEAREIAQLFIQQHEQEKAARRARLAILSRQRLPAAFHGTEPLVVEGHAAEQILRAAEEGAFDLVVCGMRRQGAVARFLLGSTSETVVAYAPCSVLVVPPGE